MFVNRWLVKVLCVFFMLGIGIGNGGVICGEKCFKMGLRMYLNGY